MRLAHADREREGKQNYKKNTWTRFYNPLFIFFCPLLRSHISTEQKGREIERSTDIHKFTPVFFWILFYHTFSYPNSFTRVSLIYNHMIYHKIVYFSRTWVFLLFSLRSFKSSDIPISRSRTRPSELEELVVKGTDCRPTERTFCIITQVTTRIK